MPYSLLIAFGAGLVSATAFASAATGPLVVRILLFLLTPLPLFLAGLGAGSRTAAIAGITGTAFVFVAGSSATALIFAASQALPVFVLVYLAALHRQTAGATEWYPIGRIVIAGALLAAAFSTLTLFLLGGNEETIRTTLRTMLEAFVENELANLPDAPALGSNEIDEITSVMLALLPAASAISAMGSLLFNMWLAGRITLASGRLQRPWPDLSAITYPSGAPLMFAVATAAAFLSGFAGLIATAFAGPLFFAYVIMGLAVIHYITRNRPWRPFALVALYAALLIMTTSAIAALAVAILGLTESVWSLRQRYQPPSAPPKS